jgi:hypothetical protein
MAHLTLGLAKVNANQQFEKSTGKTTSKEKAS